MGSNIKFRFFFIFIVAIFGIWFLYPTMRQVYYHKIKAMELAKMSDSQLRELNKGTLNLGLDLKGGVDLVYSIDQDEMIENLLANQARFLKDIAEKKFKTEIFADFNEKNREISFQIMGNIDSEKVQQVKATISSIAHDRQFKTVPVNDTSREMKYRLSETGLEYYTTDAMDKALEIIRNRVDMFAVSEPSISRVGQTQLRIQLPGVSNVEEAIDIIGTTAQLEFRLVRKDDGNTPGAVKSVEDIMKLPKPDENREELVYGIQNPDTGKTPVYILKKEAEITGDYLTNASIMFDSMTGRPMVTLALNNEGASKFYDITSRHTKRQLAIVLDDKVQSAPIIDEPIPNGAAVIRGNFSDQEAKKLAIVLRAGALPAPLRKDTEISVGPTLGADSIRRGVTAIAFGFLLVVIYMIVYYRLSGVMANVALLMNIILVCAVLALLKGTLTLPGLAGLVLTVGMAVDANVIIFERIKEELRNGKTPRAAIDAGFEKAFSAIIDANITTIITAAILYFFGTGPIRGFAVTLGLGVASSMFTALFVVRTMMVAMTTGSRKLISI